MPVRQQAIIWTNDGLAYWCIYASLRLNELTHWGRATHICISKLTIIGSDNDLSPGRRQAIIWTNDGILLIGHLGTNFSEILSKIHTFSFKKMQLKTSSAKWRPFYLGLNELKHCCFMEWNHPIFLQDFSNSSISKTVLWFKIWHNDSFWI